MESVTAGRPTITMIWGSIRSRADELDIRNPDVARQAGAALGRALANKGLAIVVYSSDPQFIEADVVRGYVESGDARPGSIQIRRPREAEDGEFRRPPSTQNSSIPGRTRVPTGRWLSTGRSSRTTALY